MQDHRIGEILNQIVRFSKGDYSGYVEVSEDVDEIDAISAGLNALGEILHTQYVTRTQTHSAELIKAKNNSFKDIAASMVLEKPLLCGDHFIFETAPDAIVVINAQGIVNQWNAAAERMFGWRASEVEGKPLHEFIIPQRCLQSHLNMLSRFVKLSSSGDQLFTNIRFPGLCRNGKEVKLEVNVSATARGDEPYFLAFVRDVTSGSDMPLEVSVQKPIQERITERQHWVLFENNPMPMWVIDPSSLRFLDVNESAIAQYGYTRKEFLSMTTLDIRPEDDKKRYKNLDRTATGTQNRGVWRHLKKDGSLIFVEVLVHEINFEQNAARLIVAVDVTQRKNAEDSLESSENRFRKIFHSKLIGFFIWNTEFEILQANDVLLDMLGFSREDFLEKRIDMKSFAPPEYITQNRIPENGNGFSPAADPFEINFITKDKGPIQVLIGTAAIDRDLYVSYVMDISQQKRMANEIMELNKKLEQRVEERTEELLVANKELESFTYSVSHDLRAPLRAIHGYSQLLVEGYGAALDLNGIRTLNNIKSNAKRMGRLIDDLLTFSRMGKRKLNRAPIEINRLVDNVLNNLRHYDMEKISITVHDLGTDTADRTLMQLVFQNLIANAIKYSNKKVNPAIEIGIDIALGGKAYFVKDNGAGFDMRYYDKLFGVFHRLHGDDEFEGTGVGLAIVHRIVTRHGGKVWAFSEVDKGATFFFTLH
jgi:PAS domain S-box-containing protein